MNLKHFQLKKLYEYKCISNGYTFKKSWHFIFMATVTSKCKEIDGIDFRSK